jgi:hypothetical protein
MVEMLAVPGLVHNHRTRDTLRAALDWKLADRMRAQTAALQETVVQVAQLNREVIDRLAPLAATLIPSAPAPTASLSASPGLTWLLIVLSVLMAAAADLQIADRLLGTSERGCQPVRKQGASTRLASL